MPRPQRVLRGAAVRPHLGRALPALLMIVSIAAYAWSMERYDRFLFAVPTLAAVTWRARATVAFGAAAMAASLILALGRDENFWTVTLVNQIALATVTAASAWASRVRQSKEKNLREVRTVAETVQRIVLRPLPRRLDRLDLHLLYDASTEHARVGGDFYKALRVDGGVRLMIGDVQGHGLDTVEMAALLVASFRENAYAAADLPELADRLELSVDRYVDRATDTKAADRFATVLLAEIPDHLPVIRLLSLGHPPPLIQRAEDTGPVELAHFSPPLNLAGLITGAHRVEEIAFGPGERMLMYTDGITEARDVRGGFYPLGRRLRDWRHVPSQELLERLRRDLGAHTGGGARDDMTAILIAHRADAQHTDDPRDGADEPFDTSHRSARASATQDRGLPVR